MFRQYKGIANEKGLEGCVRDYQSFVEVHIRGKGWRALSHPGHMLKEMTNDPFIPEIQNKLFLIQMPITRDVSEFFWILEYLHIDKDIFWAWESCPNLKFYLCFMHTSYM